MLKSFAILACLATACAGARNTERTGSAANFKAKDGTAVSSKGQPAPGGKLICSDEPPLGSHIPKRVCMYEEDVDYVRNETRDVLLEHPPVQQSHNH